MKRFKKSIFLILTSLILAFNGSACSLLEQAPSKAHEHNFTSSTVNPTCESEGYLTLSCQCGERIKSDEISALGHLFVEYVYNDDATCEENGTETAVCSRSGCSKTHTRDKQNSKLGHSFTNYISDGNATCEEDGTKTAMCNRLGCDETDTLVDYYSALGHSFTNYVSDGNSTDEQDGTKTAVCNRENCDKTHTVIDSNSVHVHSFTSYVSNNDATCETDGTKTATCDDANCFATDTVIDYYSALGHSFTNYVSNNDATCETDGTKTATCARANCFVTDTVTDYYSALGHSFTSYVSNNDATCETDGTKTAVCDNANCFVTDTITDYYSALGHSFINYVSNNDATYYTDGTKTAVCERFGCSETHTVTDEDSRLKREYTVTVHYNNGQPNGTAKVADGERLAQPSDPTKTNYVFVGWYANEELTVRYDFSKPITEATDIYAKYELDALTLTNTITTQTMKGVVMIYNKCYNESFLYGETDVTTSLGSGFCFHIQDGVYYFLTNCHVALKEEGKAKQQLIVEDYKGTRYEAILYSNSYKLGNAISPDYDLAVLAIAPASCDIEKLTMASTNASVNENVISLGSPKGQQNAITYGNIYRYGKVNLSTTPTSESNVTFSVTQHNAVINNGSSGGPLLNDKLEVVGVNYAGDKTTGNGCAVPIEKVREFLNSYVYN